MKNRNLLKHLFVISILLLSSCETIDLDQTEDPSTPDQSLLNPTFAFNYVQLELADFVSLSNGFTQQVTRQMAMGGNDYNDAFAPVDFNQHWTVGYGILNAVKTLEPKAQKDGQTFIIGASKVIRCYVLMTLTDIYGDIPLTEALDPLNLTPKSDSSLSIYKQVLLELDNAISILLPPTNTTDVTDLYYNKDRLKWITLAKTLKFKLFMTARLAGTDLGVNVPNEVSSLLSANDIIDTTAEDFAFKYGSNRNVPNSRHPMYNDQYELGGGAYIGNYMIWAMTVEKDKPADFDPRTGFYFYKQKAISSTTGIIEVPGRTRPTHYNLSDYNSFFNSDIRTCYTVSNWTSGATLATGGYLGRDHGNNAGIPPDSDIRAVAGVYPIGGSFGGLNTNGAGLVQKSGTSGALGAGIMPMIMSSYVQFLKAEAILTLGIGGDAKAELLGAIGKSIDRVVTPINNFPLLTPANLTTISSKKTAYLNFISSEYDLLTSDEKLELIIKEYYLASWGNGIEPYNNYRRTGYPSNFQPTLELNSGSFYYTAYYPANASSNNPNTPQSLRTRKVFWDKANLNLH